LQSEIIANIAIARAIFALHVKYNIDFT